MSALKFTEPGQLITADTSYLRYLSTDLLFSGHGTLSVDSKLISASLGTVERINKLVTVKPFRSRYSGNIGDVVIGRIKEVGSKRWRVQTNSKQDSTLLLSSINLPGFIQRRKSESDELQMREFFNEGEIICAEVQTIFHDGALGLHTRNLKYGKLVTGELLVVHSFLIRRAKSQFFITAWGVEVILGLNGMVWVGKPRPTALRDEQLDELYSNVLQPTSLEEKKAICKTRQAILQLNHELNLIDEASITDRFYSL